ncbi:MAG TPA: phosphonate ABC transporter ATP-binding protein [Chloroflexota bacterium]|nr:phosphonate ABC transporter ATP-binding protein [Chloroflexota bacterium]
MLEVRNLTKVFPNGTRALNDLSITIPDGQFVVVIGLSGSGKSTFLRCINRLVEPTSGQVVIDDEDVTAAGPERLRLIRARIGMIFQQFNLIRRESVLTNVLTGALGTANQASSLVGHWPKDEVERALYNLERVGIAEKAQQRADTLSGGQQQRVAIARTLMQRPRLLLADEPVASLDPATSHSVMRYVEQINKEDGITVICNLHFLSLARRYAQRVLALRAGELVGDLAPQAIDPAKFREIYGEDAVEVEVA